MENIRNDADLEAAITELEQTWLEEESQPHECPDIASFWGGPCLEEIMFHSNDNELEAYLETGSAAEQRAARQEQRDRYLNGSPGGTQYKVRFHHNSLFETVVEAHSADEAEELAKRRFLDDQSQAELLRAEFGHMTLEIVE